MRALSIALFLLASATSAHAQQAARTFDAPAAVQDTPQRAIDYGDFYYQRLAVHRMGSYAMIPLFATQYWLGQKLISGGPREEWHKPAHQIVAATIGGLFVVNTVTGAWNLWDSRKESDGRTKRFVHAALMMGAGAGFAYTGFVASREASDLDDGADHHRAAALLSVGVATTGTLLMWLWND